MIKKKGDVDVVELTNVGRGRDEERTSRKRAEIHRGDREACDGNAQ